MRIGLSACFFHADPKRPVFKGKTLLYAEQDLIAWLASVGALTYLLPPPLGKITIRSLVSDLDGLVLQGGSDVSPKSYGEKPLRPEWAGDFVRDQYEIALIREFMRQKKPVLGVCRGLQIINVAFGGTLYQDISTQEPRTLVHRNWEIYQKLNHLIICAEQSILAKLYGKNPERPVVSVHHQGIKTLGKRLVIEALSPQDKIIEAVRLDDPSRFVWAVQWHPEWHAAEGYLDSTPILKTFINQIRRRRTK